jgi:glycerol-3-phosphate dehydrogenase
MQLVKEDPQLAAPLADGLAPLRAEALLAIRDEMATSIEDILARRLGLQAHSWRACIKAAPAVADILAQELGWPETAKQEALAPYVSKIRSSIQKAGLADRT